MIIKLNSYEALTLVKSHSYSPTDSIPTEEVLDSLPIIYKKTNKPFFVTLGAGGMIVYDNGKKDIIPGISLAGELDPVGAGDTAISAIAAVLASSGTCKEAAEIANLAAAVTVRKLGVTGTAKIDEILTVYDTIQS